MSGMWTMWFYLLFRLYLACLTGGCKESIQHWIFSRPHTASRSEREWIKCCIHWYYSSGTWKFIRSSQNTSKKNEEFQRSNHGLWILARDAGREKMGRERERERERALRSGRKCVCISTDHQGNQMEPLLSLVHWFSGQLHGHPRPLSARMQEGCGWGMREGEREREREREQV